MLHLSPVTGPLLKKRSSLPQVRASLNFPLNATEMGEFQLTLRTHHRGQKPDTLCIRQLSNPEGWGRS